MTSYDTGYRPHNRLPIKIAVAIGGAVIAVAILLWPRRRFVAIGLVIVFAAITTAWFIPDGYIQTMRDGHPVCCGEVIDRGWLRTVVVVVGAGLGALVVLRSLLHRTRSRSPNPSEAGRIA